MAGFTLAMRTGLVAGNWKANGNLDSNRRLLEHLRGAAARWGKVECAVCAPYPYLFQLQQQLSGSAIAWGAQDVSEFGAGAYTGAVSAEMLLDFGCRFAIVGHSERRSIFGEDDARVAAKFDAAQAAGLTPVLCVGETLAERESGMTMSVVGRQLAAVIEKRGAQVLENAVIAYEPVWAIGTGKTASTEQAQEVHAHIRALVRAKSAPVADGVRILYGGSVKASNAAQLFAMPDIDGGLIGGASLVAEDFIEICCAAG